MQQPAGFVGIQNLSAQGIVFQRTFAQGGEIDQLHKLGHGSTDVEVGKGRAIPFASFHPFDVMIRTTLEE